MKYKYNLVKFRAWQPSTWLPAPSFFNEEFPGVLKKIFKESITNEIRNIIKDSLKANGSLEHRGHVVAISLMCALDAVASYGYRGKHVQKFIKNHFPDRYKEYASDIYALYRNSMIHNWNLFRARLYPGNQRVKKKGKVLSFGLINFLDALEFAIQDFLSKLKYNKKLQDNVLQKYRKLKNTARA